MGRRALPKISPQLDVTGTLLGVDDLPDPWSAEALFGRTAPLEVEIGTGKGLFLTQAAAAQPDHDFFGIEIAHKYAKFAASRLVKAGCTSARVLSGDGLRLFRESFADNSLEAVHVYFPDPWWKKRHHGRRVMNESSVQQITRTLRVGGKLHFWTDVRDYYEMTLELLAEHTPLEGPLPVDEKPAEHDLDYRTHFERRTRLAELPVYRSQFVKV